MRVTMKRIERQKWKKPASLEEQGSVLLTLSIGKAVFLTKSIIWHFRRV